MKSIKTHFGVIVSLVALLFSVQFGFFVNNLVANYELSMKNEYSIILVSSKDLMGIDINKTASEVANLQPISTDEIVDKIKGKISNENIKLLSQTLPKFYNVKLKFFPNNDELNKISEKLRKIDGVNKVEVFNKTHESIYRVLILVKGIVYIFTFLITILGLMLIHKQIRIWLFEHKERIDVMTLFGASFVLKSAKLYRMAIIDSVIATIIVVMFYLLLPSWSLFNKNMDAIGIATHTIVLPIDGIILFVISIALSIIAVSFVMTQARESR